MAKNRFFMHAAQTASSMSPSHPYTVVAPDDDGDDSDICPVCDGECTCHKAAAAPPLPQQPSVIRKTTGPLSMAELSMRYATAASSSSTQSLNSPSSGHSYPPSTPTPTPPFSTPTPAPSKPSLKIKLTVPPSMLAKRRIPPLPSASTSSNNNNAPKKSSKSAGETMSDFANGGYNSSISDSLEVGPAHAQPSPPHPAPKKRGRPPKALVSAATSTDLSRSSTYKPLNAKSAAPAKQQKRSSSAAANSSVRQNLKARAAVVKKAAAKKRRRAVTSEEESSSSALSDVDMDGVRKGPYKDDDAESVQFPTFVSASALSSMSSGGSDSSSSLSDFDSDSSIEAEEENFIVADVHDKARLRRELLGGDDALLLQKKRLNHNSDWVIRPRKKSVGPSDVEMDVDTDATEDDDDDEEEDDEEEDNAEEDGEETEEAVIGMGMSMEEEEETDDQRNRYVGLATGWSEEDDESSFDADIFFANLCDSDSNSSDSSSLTPSRAHRLGPPFAMSMSMGEDGDQSDISFMSECTENGSRQRRELESLPFEVTESWDGQVVFTNGVSDSQGIVDIDFEAHASRFVGASSSASPSQDGDDDTTDASPRRRRRYGHGHGHGPLLGTGLGLGCESDAEEDNDVEMSDGGYEEEDGECQGDTTDEELVGENELPNERAMRLFSLPMSVSAINPLSTVSPIVSPGRRRRALERSVERRRRRWGVESPRAADILEGRVVFWDSEEEMEMEAEEAEERRRRKGREGGGVAGTGTERGAACSSGEGCGSSGTDERAGAGNGKATTPQGPRRGVFVPSTETKQAVIGEDKKGADVPSPHPRFKGRGRGAAARRYSAVEHLLRRHLLQSITASGLSSSVASVTSTTNATTGVSADERSPLEFLLSSAAAAAAVASGVASGSVGAVVGELSVPAPDNQAPTEAEPIELDDVLEASFLADTDPARDGSSAPSSEEGTAAAAAAVKNLSRWDLISVGAFRQTRENGWDGRHTPGSSADFGNVMKSSPLSAMLWQNGGGVGAGAGARPASASSTIKGKGSKLAKRRRIMLGGSGMSSPLILPLSSGGDRTPSSSKHAVAVAVATTPQTPTNTNNNYDDADKQQQQKSRKEQRRERKLKRKSYGPVHQPHSHHQTHQFHSHHHHPNSKTRGASSSQRSNFFAASVPPLNL